MAFTIDDVTINTIIGAGSFVSGDIRINGVVKIDGDIIGNIETPSTVIIGEKARIKGNINAKAAIVGGIVLGDIYAPKSVELLSTSAVIGDVTTKRLEVEENVILNGHCISLSNEEQYQTAADNFFQSRSIRSKAL